MEWKDKRFLFFWHREPKTGPLHAQVLYYWATAPASEWKHKEVIATNVQIWRKMFIHSCKKPRKITKRLHFRCTTVKLIEEKQIKRNTEKSEKMTHSILMNDCNVCVTTFALYVMELRSQWSHYSAEIIC
jgi:hypothetical protein